jgi:2'-5' RNA ligase
LRVLDGYAGPTWTATEITLFASHRGEGRTRPHYEPVAVVELSG